MIQQLLIYLYEITEGGLTGVPDPAKFVPDPPDIESQSRVHVLYTENMY